MISESFSKIHDQEGSKFISKHTNWEVKHGALFTNCSSDGLLEFDPVRVDHDSAKLTMDVKSGRVENFEAHQDFLRIFVHIEGYGDVLLDEFRRDGHKDEFVGSKTGQRFGDDGYTTLEWTKDGLPEGANVTIKIESHTTWGDEWFKIDDVQLDASKLQQCGCEPITEVLIHADFDHAHDPEDSPYITEHTQWQVKHGALFTNCSSDGVLKFDPVHIDQDSATLTMNVKSAWVGHFEAHQDFLKVYVDIEGFGTVLLDEFQRDGHVFRGSETGQTFGDDDYTALEWSKDNLPEAAKVTLRLESHTTQSKEWFKVDDVKLIGEKSVCELCPEGALKIDFVSFQTGDHGELVLDHVTITAEANGRRSDVVHMEAEHMHERGFHVDGASQASGHKMLKLNSRADYGKAWDYFDGTDGEYEAKIVLQDEADGESTVRVTIGDQKHVFKLDDEKHFNGGDHGPFQTISLGKFDMHKGEKVKVEIWRDGHEMGRFDKIEFHRVVEQKGDAMIFDAANPTGGDHDLYQPASGKVLIISEDGDKNDPDDNAKGGKFTFDFAVPVTLFTLDALDTEEGGVIELFGADGASLGTVEIPKIRDGAIQTVDIGGVEGVTQMVVHLNGSGALDNLCYDKTGEPELGSLGDRLFHDTDRDGIQEAGEAGVNGVTVFLLDDNGNVIATDTTEGDGEYLFEGLEAGDYSVQFDAVAGKDFTLQNQGGEDDVDSDVDATGLTGTVTLAAGENRRDVDAGVVNKLGSLSGRYFCDTNDNDVDDGQATDPGIALVRVGLLNAAGDEIAFTFTGDQGQYRFGDLAPGTYGVSFTDPDGVLVGKVLVTPNVGGDDAIDSDAIGNTTLSTISGITVVGGQDTPDNDAGAEMPNTVPTPVDDSGMLCVGLEYVLDANGDRVSNGTGGFSEQVRTPTLIDLLANDGDDDGDNLFVTQIADDDEVATVGQSITTAQGAVVTLNNDGTVSVDGTLAAPDLLIGEMETFADAFQYTVSDGTDTATGNVDLTLKGDKNTVETIEQSLPTAASVDIDLITDVFGQATGTTIDIDFAGRDDIDGVYNAWCIELPLEPILEPTDAFIYSANDLVTAAPADIGQGLLETPRIETQSNFDLANYILNKDDLGSWDFNEVQTALRVVLNAADDVLAPVDNPSDSFDTFDLVQDALINGQNYVPNEPGDLVGIVIDPDDGSGEPSGQAYIVAVSFDLLSEDCLC